MTTAPATRWEGRDAREWAELWSVPQLLILESVDSTNSVARRLATDGAPAGTVVLTDHQTAGRGRMGRSWLDAPARSILFSMLLRPGRAVAPGTAPVRVGMAIAAALRTAVGVDARLKWPNDIVCADRKIAGILCEAVTAGADTCIIAGVGLNVNQQGDDFPADLRDTAGSLAEAAGRELPRGDIMTVLIRALLGIAAQPLDPLTETERRAFAAIDALNGRAVTVSEPAGTRGVARGIDTDGALLLETAGTVLRITSATVRLLAVPTPSHSSGQP